MAELFPGQPRRLVNAASVRTDYRLLEVSEELLGTILKEGVVFKGVDGDEAVLCTASTTYAVKYVETTNQQLLVAPSSRKAETDLQECQDDENMGDENVPPMLSPPGLQTQLQKLDAGASKTAPVVVTATNQSHLEVVETAPRLHLLEQLLSQRLYGLDDESQQAGPSGTEPGQNTDGNRGEVTGTDAGDPDAMDAAEPGRPRESSTAGLYTTEDLLQRVQASAKELRSGLKALGAVQLGQHWRLVEAGYLGTLLEMLISTAQQEGYPLNAIPASSMCDNLRESGYEDAVVMHCLATYGAPCASAGTEDVAGLGMEVDGVAPSGRWVLDERKTCVYFAAKLLAGGRPMPLSEFMVAWQAAVPEGMQTTLDMLKGEALVAGKGHTATIKRFSAQALPKDPAKRFQALFAEQPKWEASHLEPYIAGLKVPGLNAGALLLKYARASQPNANDPLSYSAR